MTTIANRAADPVQAWRQLYVDAADASPTVRHCVATAMRHAEHVWEQALTDRSLDTDTRVRLRGQAVWSRIALAAYDDLMANGAYAHLAADPPNVCHLDIDEVWQWLTEPSDLPGFADMTVAESWGVDTDFDAEHPDATTIMATLVAQAQKADLLSVAGHSITLRPIIDTDDTVQVLILLQTPSGAVFASHPIAPDHLTDDRRGVAAAAAVVSTTARTVNELLADQLRVAATHTAPAANQPLTATTSLMPPVSGRAFGRLDLAACPVPPQPATADPGRRPEKGPRR